MNWIRKHKADIALTALSVIMTLSAVDAVLYFTGYRYLIAKLVYPRFYFMQDREIGFDISPNFATTTHIFSDFAYPVWSNSIGCFDTAYANETPYVYLTGDSFTWGFAPFDDKWGKKVESLAGMRVVTCGVGGFGTKQELIKTTRNLARLPTPKLIIVGYTRGNDVDDDANFPNGSVYNGYSVRNLAKGAVTEAEAEKKYALFDEYCTLSVPSNPTLQKIRCWFNNHSVLYNLIKNNVRGIFLSVLPQSVLQKSGLIVQGEIGWVDVNSDAEYKKHLQNILGFKDLAAREGSKLLLVLVPGDNEKLKPFLDKEVISYLDLGPIFKKYSKVKPLRWKVDGHWNIAGNHLVGFMVSKFIIENDFIKVSDKKERIMMIDAQIKREFGGIL